MSNVGLIGGKPEQDLGVFRLLRSCLDGLMTALGDGVHLIALERARQLTLGYDAAHDDAHTDAEVATGLYRRLSPLVRMALTYLLPGAAVWPRPDPPSVQDRVVRLVKAGALIAAEVDRLHRISTE